MTCEQDVWHNNYVPTSKSISTAVAMDTRAIRCAFLPSPSTRWPTITTRQPSSSSCHFKSKFTNPLSGYASASRRSIIFKNNLGNCSSKQPQCCSTDPLSSPADGSVDGDENENEDDSVGIVRDLPLIALSMTAGNDVLFPGCHQVVNLDEDTAKYVTSLVTAAETETQEFVYIPLNAWGDAGTVGTVAVVEDIAPSLDATDEFATKGNVGEGGRMIICSGVARVHVHSISDDMRTARVEMFNDDVPTDEKLTEIENLEQQLVSAMKDIVTLTIKISDDDQHTREKALEDTLKRVESFYTQNGNVQDTDFWMMQLSPTLRRELLSFIVIDMLSVSFMDRRSILEGTDTANRLEIALQGLEPFVKELAAKGAILGALGRGGDESSSDSKTSPSSPPPSSPASS